MKNFILTILTLTVSVVTLFGQTINPTTVIMRYQKVTEYVFDEKTQNYIATDTIEYSGAISIDHIKVFIKGYNEKLDKILKIFTVEKEEGTNRELYYCDMDGENYTVTITPDRKYLTQIGINDKYIYELQTNNEINIDDLLISIENKPNSKVIYLAHSLDVKPIFGNAKTFEEGEKLLNKYISSELEQYDHIKSGTSYISIVISKEGKVEDVKLIYGKNEEFNKVALEIVKNLPDWEPGKQRDECVNTSYNVEVKK